MVVIVIVLFAFCFFAWLLAAVINKLFSDDGVQNPEDPGVGFRLISWLVLPLNHLLLGAVTITACWQSRVLDYYGYLYLWAIFLGIYIAAQWLFLWRLKSTARRNLLLAGIFQVGLLMMFISQVLLISLNWSLLSAPGHTLKTVILKFQAFIVGLIVLVSIVAGLYRRLIRKKDAHQTNTRAFQGRPLQIIGAACCGLLLMFVPIWPIAGNYEVKPRPFNEPMTALHLGQMTVMVPESWQTEYVNIRLDLRDLPYCHLVETLFENPNNGDKEFEDFLEAELQSYYKRFDYHIRGVSLEWEDVGSILSRPAKLVTIIVRQSDYHYISFFLAIKYEKGYVTVSPYKSSGQDFRRFPDGPLPTTYAVRVSEGQTGNQPVDINQYKAEYFESIKVLLANYQWAEADAPPRAKAFKTRYGFITLVPEIDKLYSNITFMFHNSKFSGYRLVLNMLNGKGTPVRDRDLEDLAADSTTIFKLHKGIGSIVGRGRHFYHRASRMIDHKQGWEFFRGGREKRRGHSSFKIAFTWYDDRYEPQTALELWSEGPSGEGIDSEAEELAGLWQAITDSIRFAAP